MKTYTEQIKSTQHIVNAGLCQKKEGVRTNKIANNQNLAKNRQITPQETSLETLRTPQAQDTTRPSVNNMILNKTLVKNALKIHLKNLGLCSILCLSLLGSSACYGNFFDSIKHGVEDLGHDITKGVNAGIHGLKSITNKLDDTFSGLADKVADIGKDIGDGVLKGIDGIKVGIDQIKHLPKTLDNLSKLVLGESLGALFGSPHQEPVDMIKQLEGPAAQVVSALLFNKSSAVRKAMGGYITYYLNTEDDALNAEVTSLLSGKVPEGTPETFYKALFGNAATHLETDTINYNPNDLTTIFPNYGKGAGVANSARDLTILFMILQRAFKKQYPNGDGSDFKAFVLNLKAEAAAKKG